MRPNISPEELRSLLKYEPETGRLFWRHRPSGRVQWNAKFSGKEAFTAKDSGGYRSGRILNKSYRAHRVIWAIAHGEWPKLIDHIDGNPANNRLSNLREVSQSENMRNASMHSRNTSGYPGVSFDKSRMKWVAAIRADGQQFHLGRFACKSGAILTRRAAEQKYNFHENHGRT